MDEALRRRSKDATLEEQDNLARRYELPYRDPHKLKQDQLVRAYYPPIALRRMEENIATDGQYTPILIMGDGVING